jgi:putative membrane protein
VDFDTAYVAAQLAGHEEALNLTTHFAKSGVAASLKAHAQQTAPVIQMYYDHIKRSTETCDGLKGRVVVSSR